eukprot:m.32404 g.32404  ORF g.32404 m.32404 type:complete len:125 (-) comp7042_c1_seq1:526-900(-)
MLKLFPKGSFGEFAFDELMQPVNTDVTFTMDVSTDPPNAAGWWEVGNEAYDPRQGPLPSGYTTAQDYLKATQEVVTTIQRLSSSDDQSMPILLRPEFKLVGCQWAIPHVESEHKPCMYQWPVPI